MATFTLHQTQNHFISKLPTNTPITQKPMLTRVRMSYQESSPSVAVVGVSGSVGQEFLSVLSDGGFPYRSIKRLASKRSAAKQLSFQDKTYTVAELTEDRFNGVDIALFSTGGSIGKNFGTIAVEKGRIVVDKSSTFRMVESMPRVISEVNPEAISGIEVGMGKFALIANPNCSTINCLMAATPFLRHDKVTCIVVSTYQAASGAGAASMKELELQTREVLEGQPPTCKLFSPQYAFSLFSHNAPVLKNGYNEGEMKMEKDTRKIWNDNDVRVTATCIRVPVMHAHAESVNVQFEKALDKSQRGPRDLVIPRAADNSIEPVTDRHTDVIIILQLPTDMNVMEHAIDILCQNDNIRCQVMKSYTKEQLIKNLSHSGRRVIIATDHGGGYFLDKIASYTSGVVIGVPMRASEVTGAKPEYIGMSPKLPVELVEANNAIGAAKLALTICAFGHPQARGMIVSTIKLLS